MRQIYCYLAALMGLTSHIFQVFEFWQRDETLRFDRGGNVLEIRTLFGKCRIGFAMEWRDDFRYKLGFDSRELAWFSRKFDRLKLVHKIGESPV
ncbi:hypothetical protein QQ045_026905 [Rhodiola kirilowii]